MDWYHKRGSKCTNKVTVGTIKMESVIGINAMFFISLQMFCGNQLGIWVCLNDKILILLGLRDQF